jgi:hypothetical protein
MSQVGYYLIIIGLAVGNLLLAVVAYWQRDKQIQGNRLREQQLMLAEMRNDMAERRLACLEAQTRLLHDIRRELRNGSGAPKGGNVRA